MKRLRTLMSMLAVIAAVSCAKNPAAGEGQVVFVVSNEETVVDCTKSNVSDYTTLPSTEDFSIIIKDAQGKTLFDDKLSAWDSSTLLTSGTYSVTASCGDIEIEGFDKPYFYGNVSFTVVGGQTSQVSVPVSLENTIVKIECTQNFKNYYKDYIFALKRGGEEIVSFSKEETRAAFVDGYKFTLTAKIESETKTYDVTREYSNLDVATAYTILFDVTTAGGSGISITFNDQVEEINLGDKELNE